MDNPVITVMDNPAIREFDEIRPYEPGEMRQAFDELINDRQFQLILKGFVPWLPKGLRNGLLKLAYAGIKTPLDFQLRFMKPVVKYIIRKHTDGCTFDDSELHAGPDARFTFISNHRDIVLDSAFLDVMLIDSGYPTTVEIGIGDNLLIYPWIKRLVRMNKAFTVRRSLSPKEMLRSSQLMSRYIHFAVTQKKENIWIAQREGRAKDSNDRTQDSVLKMLAMGAPDEIKNPADRLRDLNIVPLTISYEFDPCDYLKAQEMLSAWIAIFIVVISCSPAIILLWMNLMVIQPMLPIIRKQRRRDLKTIWIGNWQRLQFRIRMRLSCVVVCLICMQIL